MSTAPIITLLMEIESAVADIEAQPPTADANVVAARASECCEQIRDALMAGDATAAAWAGCQLGERLAEIRRLGEIARLAAEPPVNRLIQRAHDRAVERRETYLAFLDRGFSPAEACRRAAKKLDVSPRTIRRELTNY
jgi:hypothetical protein